MKGKVEDQSVICPPTITDRGSKKRPIQSGKANLTRDIMTLEAMEDLKGPLRRAAVSPPDSEGQSSKPLAGEGRQAASWAAEKANQAALTGLACCFQERCQVRLRCPARWRGPWAGRGGGKGTCTHTMQILAPRFNLCSSPIPSFSPFHEDTVQRPLWFLSATTSAYQAFCAIMIDLQLFFL